jgi:hypothetical protein
MPSAIAPRRWGGTRPPAGPRFDSCAHTHWAAVRANTGSSHAQLFGPVAHGEPQCSAGMQKSGLRFTASLVCRRVYNYNHVTPPHTCGATQAGAPLRLRGALTPSPSCCTQRAPALNPARCWLTASLILRTAPRLTSRTSPGYTTCARASPAALACR